MALADRPPQRLIPLTKLCGIAKILQALDDADRQTLSGWLADGVYQGEALARRLTSAGHPVKGDTVNRHRRGVCSCGTR